MTRGPQFFILDPAECREVLARNHVGRIAFREQDRVTIRPVGYVARDNWLFLRSAYGATMESLEHDPFVAFEVDEIVGPFDWRSVVVHGTIYLLPTNGAPIEQREARRAMDAIRSVMPGAFSPSDPVPERQILYGLNIQEVSGRMAQSRSTEPGQRRVTPPLPPASRKPSDTF
jgi:uncharacterized protein